MKKKANKIKVVKLEVVFRCDNGHDVRLEQPFIKDSNPEKTINAINFSFHCAICKREVTRQGIQKISARLVE